MLAPVPAGLDGVPGDDRVSSPARTVLLDEVAAAVAAVTPRPNVVVGVDGASGTGKSTFADELAEVLASGGRDVVRASVDSFHRPRAERYRRGKGSADGYYLDSHDLPALRARLLEPFASGAGTYVTAVFDEPADAPIVEEPREVPRGAILLVDGLFLHRPELVRIWDVSLFLLAPDRREAAWQDHVTRGLPTEPSARAAEVERRIEQARRSRYVDGQARYEREASPLAAATFVIDNDDLAAPCLVRRAD